MKKIIYVILSVLFFLISYVIAEDMIHQHKGHSEGMEMRNMGDIGSIQHDGCLLCNLNADFSVKEIKDGVILTIKAKKDGDDAKTIKENIRKWLEIKKDMASVDDEIVVCPVMGKKIKKSEAVAKMDYKGKTYYLCCKYCINEFKKNPEKYVKK